MNCLAWLRLNNSRPAVASPISRMPRRLFQLVLERVRSGISTQMSRFLNAHVATVSARLTILPRVTLSRSLRRLLPAVGFLFAIRIRTFLKVLFCQLGLFQQVSQEAKL